MKRSRSSREALEKKKNKESNCETTRIQNIVYNNYNTVTVERFA